MFYPDFLVPEGSYLIPFLVLVGVLYALGAKYFETHFSTLFPFFPLTGSSALTEEAKARLKAKAARLRLLWEGKAGLQDVA